MFKQNKLKKKIFNEIKDSLISRMQMSEKDAIDLMKKRNIEKYIDMSPDVWMHFNEEQIVSRLIIEY